MKGSRGTPSRLVGRKALRKRKRPQGQCRACYEAGLPVRVSVQHCANCQRGRSQ